MATEEILEEVPCDECGKSLRIMFAGNGLGPPDTAYKQVDGGLCLNMVGHYGGYTDARFYVDDPWMVLCDDCCDCLVEMFPKAMGPFVCFTRFGVDIV